MKNVFALAFASLLFNSGFAQKINIQPSVLDFRVGPSGVQSQSVRISNLSDRKIKFIAYLADWLRDSTGGHQYFRADTLPRSCASWINISKSFLEVEPGKSEELIVRLNTPADQKKVDEMKWAMLFLQAAEEQDSSSRNKKNVQTEVKEIIRVGIHIYETPPQLSAAQARAVSLKPGGEKNTYELLMKNTGNVMLQCKAYLELTNPADGKSYQTEKIEFPVFPDGTRKVKLTLPANIPKGKYSALAILDIGEDLPLEGIEKTIEVL